MIKRLFNRPIYLTDTDQTLVEQVYNIFREEIHSNRWHPGDRLPSLLALTEMTGLSRSPLQRAFDRLREEGYIRQAGRAGTFLESINPEGSPSLGAIGVAVQLGNGQEPSRLSYAERRLPRIIEKADELNYMTEVKYLQTEDNWDRVDLVGGVFSDQVKGVICLYSFPHAEFAELSPDRLPFVYIGTNTSDCLPVVCGDTHDGFYRLTKHLISLGHRNIVCLCDPLVSERERINRMMAHEKAMRQAGLSINEEAAERSLSLQEGDLTAIREFMLTYNESTVIMAMRPNIAHDVITVADMLGIRIPQDLSVTGQGRSYMRPHGPEKLMVRLDYQFDLTLGTAFNMLFEQMKTRRTRIARVLNRPIITEGHSVGPPRKEKYLVSKTEPAGEKIPSVTGSV